MSTPLVSIIIPVFNVEKFLSQCLDSILSQNYDKWECILVDDGSPDKSGLICDEYAKKDSRFKIIHKTNGGVSSARNDGLQVAQAEIVSFVDSDDWVTPDYCEKIIEQMSDDTDLLFFQANHHYLDNSICRYIPQHGIYLEKNTIEKELEHLLANDVHYEFFGYTWNKAFRKSILEKHNIQFTCDLSFKEDELFTLQYASKIRKLKVIPNVLYEYRVIASGLTHKEKHSSEFRKLFAAEETLIPAFRGSALRNCLYARNANFLFRAFMEEKNIVKTLYSFHNMRKYYKEHPDMNTRHIIKILSDKSVLLAYCLGVVYKTIKKAMK